MTSMIAALLIAVGTAVTLGFGVTLLLTLVRELIQQMLRQRAERKFIEYIRPDDDPPKELPGAQVIQFVKKEKLNDRKH